jgi:hypothetical protein
VEFAEIRLDWLKTFLRLRNGAPSQGEDFRVIVSAWATESGLLELLRFYGESIGGVERPSNGNKE